MSVPFDARGVVARLAFSAAAVAAVYNPSGYSWWHWLWRGEAGFWPKLAVTLVLFLLHGFIWASVRGVLKWRGVFWVLATLLAGTRALAAWLPPGSVIDGALVLLVLLYAVGLSYSQVHHLLAGISHVEKVH